MLSVVLRRWRAFCLHGWPALTRRPAFRTCLPDRVRHPQYPIVGPAAAASRFPLTASAGYALAAVAAYLNADAIGALLGTATAVVRCLRGIGKFQRFLPHGKSGLYSFAAFL